MIGLIEAYSFRNSSAVGRCLAPRPDPAARGNPTVRRWRGGISQQELAGHLRILPSRLVVLIDQVEERGMIERRADPEDRRSYALHLTAKGSETLKTIGRLARDHQETLLVSLTADERDVVASLLRKVADQQGLRPGVHPGFARLHPQGPPKRNARPAKA